MSVSVLQLMLMALVLVVLVFWLARRTFGAGAAGRKRISDQPAPPPNPASQIPDSKPPIKDYFLSHASQDANEAKKLATKLEAAGLTCWIAPRNIRPGQSYGEAIADAAAHATKAMLVLISAASERSASVTAELEIARRFEKPVMPVILNNHQPGKAILYYVGASQWLPYDGASATTVAALTDAISNVNQ